MGAGAWARTARSSAAVEARDAGPGALPRRHRPRRRASRRCTCAASSASTSTPCCSRTTTRALRDPAYAARLRAPARALRRARRRGADHQVDRAPPLARGRRADARHLVRAAQRPRRDRARRALGARAPRRLREHRRRPRACSRPMLRAAASVRDPPRRGNGPAPGAARASSRSLCGASARDRSERQRGSRGRFVGFPAS